MEWNLSLSRQNLSPVIFNRARCADCHREPTKKERGFITRERRRRVSAFWKKQHSVSMIPCSASSRAGSALPFSTEKMSTIRPIFSCRQGKSSARYMRMQEWKSRTIFQAISSTTTATGSGAHGTPSGTRIGKRLLRTGRISCTASSTKLRQGRASGHIS